MGRNLPRMANLKSFMMYSALASSFNQNYFQIRFGNFLRLTYLGEIMSFSPGTKTQTNSYLQTSVTAAVTQMLSSNKEVICLDGVKNIFH